MIPNVALDNLRDFSKENIEERIRIAGPTKIRGNSYTYPLRGERERAEMYGGGVGRIDASLRVWVTFTSDGWLVENWWFQIHEVDYSPYEAEGTPDG
jgi:hypothetical protein